VASPCHPLRSFRATSTSYVRSPTGHAHRCAPPPPLPSRPTPPRWVCAAYMQSGKTQEAGKNWGIFDWMNQFLQSAWELEEGACTLMESLAADNVRYAEVTRNSCVGGKLSHST
jgi:hypothetical protein